VIVPVYDEQRTVSAVVEALIAKKLEGLDKEIVIVEGNSTDGTRDAVLRYRDVAGVQVVLLDRNRGKGYAVREGLRRATGDIVLIQDADLEYDIADYDRLLAPLLGYRRAVVLGSRHSGGPEIHSFTNQPLLRAVFNLGHIFLTGLFNLLYRQRLRDPWTMYKVFRRDCIHRLKLECDRFDFDVELLAKLVRKGFTPLEIPVTYRSRSFKEGKKVRVFTDPWTWIWACLKYRLVSPYER
jgi:glycosyltransferase involved in cell wall biosynthesis